MKRLGLPKRARLQKRRQFLAVTDRGKTPDLKFSGPCFLLLGRENGLDFNRLGVTVSKKTAPRAVDRNLIKRLVREFFRLNTPLWPQGFDLVFIARSGANRAGRQKLWEGLRPLGRKMAGHMAEPEPKGEARPRPKFIAAALAISDFMEWLFKGAAIFLIYVYQRLISPLLPPSCRFRPTCSRYAVSAIVAHGFWRGSYLAGKRLLKCHPFHPGGYDPVPPAKGASGTG